MKILAIILRVLGVIAGAFLVLVGIVGFSADDHRLLAGVLIAMGTGLALFSILFRSTFTTQGRQGLLKTFGRIAGWICLAVSILMLIIGERPVGILLAFLGGFNLALSSKLRNREKAVKEAQVAEFEATMRSIGKARLERKAEEEAAVQEEFQRRKEQARQKDENRAVLLDRLGAQYESDGDIEKAIFYYAQAVAAAGVDIHPYERLATLYRIRGEYAEELKVSTAAVQMLERQSPRDAGMIARFKDRIAYAEAKLRVEIT